MAIRVEGVSKTFKIPLDKPATLKYRVTHPRSTSRYRAFPALRDISFEVGRGEFLGIIGHNGCGKSTLLKILSGIYVADSGTVAIDGRVSPFLELGVGFNPELNARENVFLSGAVLGLTRKELARRVDDILAFAEIEEFAQTKLKNFSSGMQVRLAFSVAIQADAEILLMDEVLAVGDASFQEKCFDVFSEYKRSGRTIVLVTHDMTSVHNYCDRAILLDHGRLVVDGSPGEVTAHYRRMLGAAGDHAGAAATQDVDDAADAGAVHFGDSAAKITGVRVLDEAGTEHTTFTTGRPMTIEVTARARRNGVEPLVCGVGIQRTDGLDVSCPTSTWADTVSPPLDAGDIVVFRHRIEELGLLQGAYFLNIGIFTRHFQPIVVLERKVTVRVFDERSRPGLVAMGGTWEVEVSRAGSDVAEGPPPSLPAAVDA